MTVNSPAAVLAKLGKQDFDVVLIDLNYRQDVITGKEGLDLLKQISAIDSSIPVVVMTAYASIQLAVEAVRLGAKDFLQKPWENERLVSILRTQFALREALRGKERLEAENSALRSTQIPSTGFVANSDAMRQVREMVEQVAPSDANVMITGENGTGKGVVARMLHQSSLRSAQPLITVNMGGLPEGVFESEMFGHVKGAFTDARADRAGRFELADNGTLFLDEIANLTATQQAKLLRVLETGEFERVGSSKTRRADVRILTATNAELQKEIEAGKFRGRSFLSAQYDSDPFAASARASRGHSISGRRISRGIEAALPQADSRISSRFDHRFEDVCLAWKCSRVASRHGASGFADPFRDDPGCGSWHSRSARQNPATRRYESG